MIPVISLADEVAVTAASATFALAMDTTQPTGARLYRYVANVGTWIAQGSAPLAAAAGSIYVAAGVEVVLDGADGAALAVIDDGAAGKATLVPLVRV